MGGRVETLVKTLEARNEHLQHVFHASIEAGSEALEGILASARESMGHLQFQDLMIQDLEGIERVLEKSHGKVETALAGSGSTGEQAKAFLGTIGAELEEEAQEDAGLESGEVLLF
jgi:hypothetical protein